MKTIFKLISSLLCLVLALGMGAFGFISLNNYRLDITNYISWNESDGYFEIEMGHFENKPLKWKMVLKETLGENGKVDVESTANYSKSSILSGTYYFLLNTYIPFYLECSFANSYDWNPDDPTRLDKYGIDVPSNEYAVSNIRNFLNGVDVWRSYNKEKDIYTPAPYSSGDYVQSEPDNFLELFSIEDYKVYSLIEGRSLKDLYSNAKQNELNEELPFNDYVEKDISTSTEDKLWLLSWYEAYKMGGTTNQNCDERRFDYNYWLRSPFSYPINYYYQSFVSASGYMNVVYNAGFTYVCRPAFKITI